jgi:multidrug resistance efflux pump
MNDLNYCPLIEWQITELDRAEEQLGMAEESIRELQVQIAGLQAQLTVERAKHECIYNV